MDAEGFLDDLLSDIKDFFYSVAVDLVDLLADLVEEIPVPEFLQPLGSYISNLPPEALYFASAFELPYGFSVIGAAVTSRMLLSLIPFIGGAFR